MKKIINLPAVIEKTRELTLLLDELEKQLAIVILNIKDPILRSVLETIQHLGNRISNFLRGIKRLVKRSDTNNQADFVVKYFIKNFSVVSQNAYITKKVIEYVLNHLDWLNQHAERIIDALKALYAGLLTMQIDCEEIYKLLYGKSLRFDFGLRGDKVYEKNIFTSIQEPYNILGIKQDASYEQVKSVFRMLVKKLHPDLNPNADAEEFLKVEQAYQQILYFMKKWHNQ